MKLLAARDVFSYDVAWKAILAVALILFGVSIIFKSIFRSNNDREVEKKVKSLEGSKIMDSQVAVFSDSDKNYNKEVFNGSNLTAVFGGIELDLRNAIFKKDTVIKAFCLFGGIEIKVPEDVQVKTRSGVFFGGISDDRKNDTNKSKHIIYIDATGGFGGIEIIDHSKKKR